MVVVFVRARLNGAKAQASIRSQIALLISVAAFASARSGASAAFAVVASGCGSGALGSAPPSIARHAALVTDTNALAPQASSRHLCVGEKQYQTMQDDEFSQDRTLKYTSNQVVATPAPNGAMWSSQAHAFAYSGRRNGVGTDDAYYTDPSQGFGGYNPFSLSGGALRITAKRVPAKYASSPQLVGAGWLSGLLQAPALTFGYVEVSAKEPNLQGFWPAPLWLIGLHGSDGNGNGYEELDANEHSATRWARASSRKRNSAAHSATRRQTSRTRSYDRIRVRVTTPMGCSGRRRSWSSTSTVEPRVPPSKMRRSVRRMRSSNSRCSRPTPGRCPR